MRKAPAYILLITWGEFANLSARFGESLVSYVASQVMPVVKYLPANAGDTGDVGSTPGSGRCPGEGILYPLQYSCLKNPMDKGA